jgi:hypothetical protein
MFLLFISKFASILFYIYSFNNNVFTKSQIESQVPSIARTLIIVEGYHSW